MAEKALTAVIEAYVQGVSTRSVDELVKAMGMTGISKSQVSRLCEEIDGSVVLAALHVGLHVVRGHQPDLVPERRELARPVADAEAICEAVTRPSIRFVPIKTEAQQAVLVMHRARELLVRQRTQLVNAVRAHLAEFGIIEPQGIWHVGRLRTHLEDEGTVPDPGRKKFSVC